MNDKNIHKILFSKPHNPHYLNRYWKFIQLFKRQIKITGVTENHHICPKANDLFPEYKLLKKYNWNSVHLTKRQHWVAHWMLAKAYGNSQLIAFYRMTKKSENRITSSVYERFRKEVCAIISKNNSGQKPKISEFRKNKVPCYDDMGSFLLISKEEFHSRIDVYGINKNGNTDFFKTKEFKQLMSNCKKNSIWIFHPDTNIRHFIQPNKIDYYLSLGFIIGHTGKVYDRNKYINTCHHCNKKVDTANYSRWHGDNCKFKP